MIFITLGSQKFQFNRLLVAVDRLIADGKIKDDVIAQTGYSDYEPQNYKYKQFLDHEEFADIMEKAEIVITHGGTGAIISAVKKGKKVIAVPRLAKYGEHVDDHQIQLLKQFDGMGIIEACYETENLETAYKKSKVTEYETYVSNTSRIIESIERFIER